MLLMCPMYIRKDESKYIETHMDIIQGMELSFPLLEFIKLQEMGL